MLNTTLNFASHASRFTLHALRFTHRAPCSTLLALRSSLFAPSSSLHVALFLFLLAIYLLTYTPHINSSDGLAMFSTAESIIRRGALDIEQIRWMDLQQGTYGLDGLLYSRKGIGVPIGLLPLTWLGLVIPWFGPVGVSLLFNAIVTALTAVLLLVYLQELGYSQGTGLIVALTFGLATLAWPYAKSLFSDPFSGLLLLVAAYFLLKFSHAKNLVKPLGYCFLTGLFLGWNVATRYAEALFVPVFGLLLLYYLGAGTRRREPRSVKYRLLASEVWLPILAFGAPILFIGLALIAFNISRYGDPLNTGYLPNETFSAVLWDGIVGQLISPARGLLLYSPVLILSLAGFVPFFRRFRAEAIVALSIILIHLLLYGKWFMWHGGYAWGPRFMVPTLPFWAIFLAPIVARAFPEKNNQMLPLRLIFLALVVLSLATQLLAVTIDFTPFLNSLLDTGLPLYARQTFFDLQYSPFVGVWAFIAPGTLDLAWTWQGRVNWWLLGVLVGNVAVTGFFLKRQMLHILPCLSTLIAVIFLLVYTHSMPATRLQEAVAALNKAVRPVDAVITNDPEMAMPFAELYKGRAPVLGLNHGGFPLPDDVIGRLIEPTANHAQVWWLPNWLPPEESAVEQILLTEGFRARNDNFEGQRLALFAFPPNLTERTSPVKATFADLIRLDEIARPQDTPAGVAFPIELRWQAMATVAEDYHVFIHLLAEDGQIVAQGDGQPVLWARPTSTWAVGETIVDRHGLWISPETAQGTYQLLVGLYRPADGFRLPLPDGEDAVRFEVRVE